MKKRATSMLLAFALFVGMLSMIPIKANAAWTAEYSPYPKIESSYSSGVSCGTVRYISQISGSTYFYSAYWPSGAFGGYSSPGWECGTASISMALSYVGVNKTPKAILEANNGYTYFTGWGPSTSSPSVSTGMNNYINGNGKYSPVIIHLPNYSSDGHWVVLIGKVSSNVYYVLDPANAVCWNITINGTSATYTKNGYTINDTIDRTYQYYNATATTEHTCDKGEFAFYEAAHPHCNCYKCSICGETWRDRSSTNELTSCDACSEPEPVYVKPGVYTIHSARDNNYVVDIQYDSTENCANIQLYRNLNNDVQKFRVVKYGDYYLIQSVYSGLWLDVAYPYSISRSNVQLFNSHENNEEKWWFEDAGNGYVYIRNYYGNFLDIAGDAAVDGANIQVYDTKESDSQRWKLVLLVDESHTHQYSYKTTTEATCTSDGVKTYTCSCGDSYTETIPAYGHSWCAWEIKASATCTQDGLRERLCQWCYIRETETIPRTGHNYEDTTHAPTCTQQGYTYHLCSYCGSSYIDSYKEALGHAWNQGVVTKEPTETETGEKLFTCIRCTATRTETIPMLDHSHSYNKTVFAPTCTEQGYTEYTCSCGDTYTADIISAIGHIWNDGAVTKEPTGCDTLTGEITYTCNSCGEMRTEFFARGHNLVTDPAVTPTCTEAGLTEGIHCSLCNELVKAQETVPALGHSYVDAVTQPTCTQNGYTLHTCSVCSESYTDATVAPLGHTWNGGVVMRVATCTANGKMKYTCTVCGAEKEEVIIATGHNYMDTVIRPTCTETGYTTHTCSNCGDNYKDTYVGATGHAWNNGIVAIRATCTKAGEKVFTCGNCGETRSEEIPALGHSYEAVVTEPTCTEAGFTTYTCGSCGDSYVTDEVEALGHNYEAVVTEPTCTEAGFTTYTCSVCGDRYVADEVEALGHNYETIVTEPTCTESGFTTYTCAFCGDSYIADESVALGHAWDDGTVTIEPTATEAGVMTYTCTREGCGETKTEEIPALGEDPDEPCDGGEDCPSAHFTDIHATDWYHEAVDFAVENGLFGGMSENTFEPNTAMTRAMLVTVLWRYAGEPAEGENAFTDVPDGQWYTDAVAWAAENNIVGGVGDNKFDPNGNITREQMATILYRYAGGKDIDTSARADLSSFPDAGNVSGYALDAMKWSVAEGLVNGSDGKLLPQGNATRAQVATILMRFIENIAE